MEEKIRQAYDDLRPDDETRQVMLGRILAEAENTALEAPAPAPKPPKKRSGVLRWTLPVAAAAVTALVLLPRLAGPQLPTFHEELPAAEETKPVPGQSEAETPSAQEPSIRQETPPVILNGPMQAVEPSPEEPPLREGRPAVGLTATAPAPRELTFEGGVYAPLSGETVEKDRLGEPLGTVGPDQPFPEGSSLYALSQADPAFRLAVETENDCCLLQSRPGEDLPGWLTAAGPVEAISVTDPAERVVLLDLTADQTADLLALLQNTAPATLTGEEAEATETARQEGETLKLQFRLPDGPGFSLELLPRLALTAADGRYYALPADFASAFGPLFEALTGGSPHS